MKLFKLEIFDAWNTAHSHPSCRQVMAVEAGFLLTKDMPKKRDYAQANDTGTCGVYDFYILEKGSIYKIAKALSREHLEHYYLHYSIEGDLTRVSHKEVLECLR
jgi:hypothetical protein